MVSAEKGLYWDDKDLSQGILRVTDQVPVGIRSIQPSGRQTMDGQWLDLSGRPVTAPRRGQTYILVRGRQRQKVTVR